MKSPIRKRNRLQNFDYSHKGTYFITICTTGKYGALWNINEESINPGRPPLSRCGVIVQTAIEQIPSHYTNVQVDKYCIMPDHVHMLLSIGPDEDEGMPEDGGRIISAPTISMVVGSMKRWVSKQIRHTIWQKSFYDHIIRHEKEYRDIWTYIDQNPLAWQEDCFYGE